MAREQQNTETKRTSPLLWLILILLLLGSAVGGVSAYLSASSNALTNEFQVDEHPTLTVNGDSITVNDPSYAVYLRAAVNVVWMNSSGNILAEIPTEGTDYTLSPGNGWFEHTDGFYYYKDKMFDVETDLTSISLTPVTFTPNNTTKEGYTLTLQIAAQTIQAVGQTDGNNPVDAVYAAWGITADQITGTP